MNILIAETVWRADPTNEENKAEYIRTINYYCLKGRITKRLAEDLLREVLK